MRILLTNDDGIHAEGLACLQRIAAALSDDVWTVAPEVEQSGMSRALTLGDPLRVRRTAERSFAVTGTPTDCVQLAVSDLGGGRGARPGALRGQPRPEHRGEDVGLSGTVAGALQAMAMGVPAIALSQALHRFHDGVVAHWETAEAYGPGIVQRLLELGWPRDVVMNVNFPPRPPGEVEAVEVTAQGFHDAPRGRHERRTDLRGRDYYWMGFTPVRAGRAGGHGPARGGRWAHLGHPRARGPHPPRDDARPARSAGRRPAAAADAGMTARRTGRIGRRRPRRRTRASPSWCWGCAPRG